MARHRHFHCLWAGFGTKLAALENASRRWIIAMRIEIGNVPAIAEPADGMNEPFRGMFAAGYGKNFCLPAVRADVDKAVAWTDFSPSLSLEARNG